MEAIHRMEQRVGTLLRCSSFYYSEPWGFRSEHAFCNLCASFHTDLAPEQVLDATQSIEQELGRNTKSGIDTETGTPIYHDRTIDIDLLRFFNNEGHEIMLQTSMLTLPHPCINKRDFVYIPLAEITF